MKEYEASIAYTETNPEEAAALIAEAPEGLLANVTDRLRALEKMAGLQEQKGGEAVPFYKALESGARALENRRKGDSEE